MQITLSLNSELPAFIAECSPAQDREVLLDLMHNTLEPKRAPAVVDFIGRSYPLVEKDPRFHKAVQRFFTDVIWKRFQKVVWSEKGTVGIDVPITDKHVYAFLSAVKLSTAPKYVENVRRFLTYHAKQL